MQRENKYEEKFLDALRTSTLAKTILLTENNQFNFNTYEEA